MGFLLIFRDIGAGRIVAGARSVLAALFLVSLAWTGLVESAHAQGPANGQPVLKIAVYTIPPYVTIGTKGEISGHSVRLWELVAAELGRRFELIPVERMEGILAGLQSGSFDLAIGAITVTPVRETLADFSHPTHPSGVAVATRRASELANAFDALTSTLVELLPMFLAVGMLVLAAGLLAWQLEKRALRDTQHEGTNIASIGDGIYWAAVTMTTVGYGDKTPKSALARVLTVIWMFVALVVISIFTGSVTAKLTSTQIGITGGAETAFRLKRLAAVRDSSGAEFLSRRGLTFAAYTSLPEALAALGEHKVDAVFNSRGALVHHVVTEFAGDLEVLSGDLSHGWMAIALPGGSSHLEGLNRAILNVLASPAWMAERERMAQEYSQRSKPDRTTF